MQVHDREASRSRTTRSIVARDWEDGGAAWARYEPVILQSLAPVDAPLLRAADAAPGHRVLDVGCGLGEPTLTLARWVGPRGHVTGLDVSRSMLAVARRRARAHGVHNVRFVRGAVESMHHARAFDRVTSRYGLMFVDDVDAAAERIAHALRPGGRFACAAWGPIEKNAYFRMGAAVSRPYMDAPPPDPSTVPGPMRFADPAPFARALRRAGLARVSVDGVQVPMVFPHVEWIVESMPSVSSTLRAAVPRLSAGERATLHGRIRRAAAPFVDGNVVRFPGFAWIVSARKNARR